MKQSVMLLVVLLAIGSFASAQFNEEYKMSSLCEDVASGKITSPYIIETLLGPDIVITDFEAQKKVEGNLYNMCATGQLIVMLMDDVEKDSVIAHKDMKLLHQLVVTFRKSEEELHKTLEALGYSVKFHEDNFSPCFCISDIMEQVDLYFNENKDLGSDETK